jgi:hypothetical protein
MTDAKIRTSVCEAFTRGLTRLVQNFAGAIYFLKAIVQGRTFAMVISTGVFSSKETGDTSP